MTVRELIEQLERFPGEAPVIAQTRFEYGFDYVYCLENMVRVVRIRDESCGALGAASQSERANPIGDAFNAVVIDRL